MVVSQACSWVGLAATRRKQALVVTTLVHWLALFLSLHLCLLWCCTGDAAWLVGGFFFLSALPLAASFSNPSQRSCLLQERYLTILGALPESSSYRKHSCFASTCFASTCFWSPPIFPTYADYPATDCTCHLPTLQLWSYNSSIWVSGVVGFGRMWGGRLLLTLGVLISLFGSRFFHLLLFVCVLFLYCPLTVFWFVWLPHLLCPFAVVVFAPISYVLSLLKFTVPSQFILFVLSMS